ncbi:MAG: hypothetical protein AAGI01_00250, partial [Myxococcota bacterium]
MLHPVIAAAQDEPGQLPPKTLSPSPERQGAPARDASAQSTPATKERPAPEIESSETLLDLLGDPDELARDLGVTPRPLPKPASSPPPDDTASPSEAAVDLMRQLFDDVRSMELHRAQDLTAVIDDVRWIDVMTLVHEGSCEQAWEQATDVLGDDALAQEPTRRSAPRLYAMARIARCAGGTLERRGEQTLRVLARGDFGTTTDLARVALGRKVAPLSAPPSKRPSASIYKKLDAARARAKRGDLDGALTTCAALREGAERGWDWYVTRRAELELLEAAKRFDEAAHVWRTIYYRTRGWRIQR